jgi:hypothetical protein
MKISIEHNNNVILNVERVFHFRIFHTPNAMNPIHIKMGISNLFCLFIYIGLVDFILK